MNLAWFYAQPVFAGMLVVYEAVGFFALRSDPEIYFPIATIVGLFGLFGLFGFIPGMILSLFVNFSIMARRHRRPVTLAERILISVEIVLVIVGLVALSFEEPMLLPGLIWIVTIIVAIVACVVISRESRARPAV